MEICSKLFFLSMLQLCKGKKVKTLKNKVYFYVKCCNYTHTLCSNPGSHFNNGILMIFLLRQVLMVLSCLRSSSGGRQTNYQELTHGKATIRHCSLVLLYFLVTFCLTCLSCHCPPPVSTAWICPVTNHSRT